MTTHHVKRNTWLFIGFFILAGMCYLLTRTNRLFLNTFMFSANFMIYIGMLIFWIQSVRARLLPTKVFGVFVIYTDRIPDPQKQ